MAPDKIWVTPSELTVLLAEKRHDYGVAYIRKDALVEWLKKEYETISWYYEKMKHVTGSVGDNSCSGKAEAYRKVIEKIESL